MRKLLTITLVLVLNACGGNSKPLRLSETATQNIEGSAFLYSSGYVGEVQPRLGGINDHATVIRIDGVEVPENITRTYGVPNAHLLQVPVGTLRVELLAKYESLSDELLYELLAPLMDGYASDGATRLVEFTPQPNYIYIPFALRRCSDTWFWIEQRGKRNMDTPSVIDPRHSWWWPEEAQSIHSDLSHPVVAGKAPSTLRCPSDPNSQVCGQEIRFPNTELQDCKKAT